VADGYWESADSDETFRAQMADRDDDVCFLRTGDLGAIHDGHLFVTGRLKDLIIVAGRNLYPQDIEATVEDADPAIRRGCCAAFSVEREGAETVVIAAEVRADACEGRQDLDELRRRLRSAVVRDHEIAVEEIALLAAHSVPKTSSGKLQRTAARRDFEAGNLRPAQAPAVEGMV
jgi:acyl-CoA synthetase (AMP-forming)/AMP-acid ligase II